MTLDEAIKQIEYIVEDNQKVVDTHHISDELTIEEIYCDDTEIIEERLAVHQKRADDFRQLAEWLKDYKRLLDQQPCEDCISRADALHMAKNEYLRGWHDALCKALSEKYSIHCEEGNFNVIQEETITGLGLSMDCALGKDIESYMSTISSVIPTHKFGKWEYEPNCWLRCSCCGSHYPHTSFYEVKGSNYCPNCGAEMEGM